MTRHNSLFRSIFLGIALLALLPTLTLAQSDPLRPVYIGGDTGDMAWSNDGQQFTFTQDTSTSAVEFSTPDSWITYDLPSQSIKQSLIWPSQPELTTKEFDHFSPLADTRTSFIYESPDHHYLVFGRGEELPDLTLADRQTGQYVTLKRQVLDPDGGPDTFRVLFSADSSAFTMTKATDFSDENVTIYVSGYASKLSDAYDILIGDLGQNIGASYLRVEDLSEDGKSVLLTGLPDASDSNKHHLYQWDANSLQSKDVTPSQAQNITGAAFSPQTEDPLLMVTESGLIQFNSTTNELVTLRNDISSDWAQDVYFSPTAEDVAFSKENGSYVEIYVVDLHPHLLPTQTPS